MLRTRVGYSGGTKKHPTYRSLSDHSEAIQIDFDPARISFEDLLEVFWNNHDPCSRPWSMQYKAAVFHHNDEQKRLARESLDRLAESGREKIHTGILPVTDFYLAEAYHQKYALRQYPRILQELTAVYPVPEDLVDSTAAARINGYLAGQGSAGRLRKELPRLGLSSEGGQKLLDIVSARDDQD